MCNCFRRSSCIIFIFSFIPFCSPAQEWYDSVKDLIYAPRYFGPNAFLFPELQNGRLGTRWELEIRGEAHRSTGDRTDDLYARLYVPIAKGRVGVELCGVVVEDYKMTPETVEERHAVEAESPIVSYGDFIINTYFQLLKSDNLFDVMADMHFKTASGGRLCDARYTDAAACGFNLTLGRDLYRNKSQTFALRLQGMAGFYCWMTNDMIHRQNDAFLYSIGGSIQYKNTYLTVNYFSLDGYANNGDHPVMLRTKFNFEFKKNSLSLRYRHGMEDCLYETYSVAYIRYF